jgi:large repetitive protein
VYRPDGGAVTPSNYYTSFSASSVGTVNLQNLPVGGTYTVVVSTPYGTPATGQLTLAAGATDNMLENGVAQSITADTAEQNVYLNFTANQGDNLELALSNLSVPGSGYNGEVQVNVVAANGTNVASYTCYSTNPGSSCRQALWNLAAGTYTVTVTPTYGGTISLTAQLQTDTSAGTLTPDTPVTVNLAQGQVQRYTFTANAGDTYAVNLTGVSSTSPTGQSIGVNVYRPDGGAITPSNYYTSFSTGSAGTMNLQNLPVGGTYTVVVYTPYGTPAAGQLSLNLVSSSVVSTTGSLGDFTSGGAGQPVNMTFSAAANANLELTLSDVNALGASTNGFEVVVSNPGGTQIANFYCYNANVGSSCTQPLWNLAAGTYTVTAIATFGGTISFNAQVQPDVIGPVITASAPATISLAAGQAERVTFTGTQGSNIVLQLAGVSTTPANQAIYVDVYEPDAGEITSTDAYSSFQSSGSNSLNLTNLPVSGTYTAVIRTSTGIPASAQLSYATQ